MNHLLLRVDIRLLLLLPQLILDIDRGKCLFLDIGSESLQFDNMHVFMFNLVLLLSCSFAYFLFFYPSYEGFSVTVLENCMYK